MTFASALSSLSPTSSWRFNGTSGDDIQNNQDLTYSGSPTTGVAGFAPDGDAISLVYASSQYCSASDTGSHYDFGTNDFSLLIAVKMADYPDVYGAVGREFTPLFAKSSYAGGNQMAWYLDGSTATKKTRLRLNNTPYDLVPTTPLDDGQWHLLLLTADRNGNASLFVDGGSTAEATVDISASSAVSLASALPLMVGAIDFNNDGLTIQDFYEGSLDVPAVWDGTLITGSQFAGLWAERSVVPRFMSVASATDTNTATVTVSKPSGTVEGDLLLCIIDWYDDVTKRNVTGDACTSSGWTEESALTNHPETYVYDTVLWKIAGASEPSTYDFVIDGAAVDGVGVVVLRIEDHDPTTPLAATPTPGDTGVATAPDPPATGTLDSGNYLVVVGAADNNTNNTPPADYQEAANPSYLSVGYKQLLGITSEAPGDYQTVSAGFATAWTIAIGPAGALTLVAVSPTDDVTTTGWSSTPLWSKIDEDPGSPDGTVITATAS